MFLKNASFRTRIAVVFTFIWMIVQIPAQYFIDVEQKKKLLEDQQSLLDYVAHSAAIVVTENLKERRREIESLAISPQFIAEDPDLKELKFSLEQLQRSYLHYSWIGLTDNSGKVLAATRDLLLGQDVSARPWFIEGSKAVFVGDLHEAVMLSKLLPAQSENDPIKFIDFAAPILTRSGKHLGVLAAHANWRWANEVMSSALTEQISRLGIEAFIVDSAGKIIYPQSQSNTALPDVKSIRSSQFRGFLNWPDNGLYLTSSVNIKEPVSGGSLRWRIVVRQKGELVNASFYTFQRDQWIVNLLTAGILLCLIWIGSGWLARPIEKLSIITDNPNTTKNNHHGSRSNENELDRIAKAFSSMSLTITEQNTTINNIGSTIEETVKERTADLADKNHDLHIKSRTDPLTGLPNRMEADERLALEFERLKRYSTDYSVCVLDIDNFKKVNDTYGHAVGDLVLQAVAKCIRQQLRSTDFVARTGGEEMLMILPETTLDVAIAVAEKVRKQIELMKIDLVGHITVSIGIAAPKVTDETDQLAVVSADTFMYAAKMSGRNRICSALS